MGRRKGGNKVARSLRPMLSGAQFYKGERGISLLQRVQRKNAGIKLFSRKLNLFLQEKRFLSPYIFLGSIFDSITLASQKRRLLLKIFFRSMLAKKEKNYKTKQPWVQINSEATKKENKTSPSTYRKCVNPTFFRRDLVNNGHEKKGGNAIDVAKKPLERRKNPSWSWKIHGVFFQSFPALKSPKNNIFPKLTV